MEFHNVVAASTSISLFIAFRTTSQCCTYIAITEWQSPVSNPLQSLRLLCSDQRMDLKCDFTRLVHPEQCQPTLTLFDLPCLLQLSGSSLSPCHQLPLDKHRNSLSHQRHFFRSSAHSTASRSCKSNFNQSSESNWMTISTTSIPALMFFRLSSIQDALRSFNVTIISVKTAFSCIWLLSACWLEL